MTCAVNVQVLRSHTCSRITSLPLYAFTIHKITVTHCIPAQYVSADVRMYTFRNILCTHNTFFGIGETCINKQFIEF